MNFDWLIPVILAVMLYACLYFWLKSKKILPHIFDFSGPFLLIKTEHVGAFDVLSKPKLFFRIFATTGIVLTILSGIAVTLLFIVSAVLTFIAKPEPTAVQNILMIPGVNQYVPSTVAVWLALVIAIVIHEFGHGILSRVEGIRVKSAGLLALVIPIGAFVEPDEEDTKKTSLGGRLRMLAAGITTNLVVGIICLVILAALLGLVVPGDQPYVSGVISGSPADNAGLLPGTIVLAVDGVPVKTYDDITTALTGKNAGDIIKINGEYKGQAQSYDITLSAIPEGVTLATNTNGYMGVNYIQPSMLVDSLNTLMHPNSFRGLISSALTFVTLPFASIMGGGTFSFLVSDTPDPAVLSEPFWGYWGIVHFLFWSAWINILVGTFNAVPIRAFDGGQMLREGLLSFFHKHEWKEEGAYRICSFISYILVITILLCILLPYIFAV